MTQSPNWPDGLPRCHFFESEQVSPNYVDDKPEFGKPLRRKRYTGSFGKMHSITTPRLTLAQVELFEGFFEETLSGGVRSFYFPRPRKNSDGSVVEIETQFSGGYKIVPFGNRFKIKFTLQEI